MVQRRRHGKSRGPKPSHLRRPKSYKVLCSGCGKEVVPRFPHPMTKSCCAWSASKNRGVIETERKMNREIKVNKKKIYVVNLLFETGEPELKTLFSKAGDVHTMGSPESCLHAEPDRFHGGKFSGKRGDRQAWLPGEIAIRT